MNFAKCIHLCNSQHDKNMERLNWKSVQIPFFASWYLCVHVHGCVWTLMPENELPP